MMCADGGLAEALLPCVLWCSKLHNSPALLSAALFSKFAECRLASHPIAGASMSAHLWCLLWCGTRCLMARSPFRR